jgi:hypothetical protein
MLGTLQLKIFCFPVSYIEIIVGNEELYKLYSSPNYRDRTKGSDVQSRNLNVRDHLRCEYLDRERTTGLAFKWPCAHHKTCGGVKA